MNVDKNDIIIGIHSIAEAILNPKRKLIKLITIEEAYQALLLYHPDIKKRLQELTGKIEKVDSNRFAQLSERIYKASNFKYNRIPSGALLETQSLEIFEVDQLYDFCKSNQKLKLLALDQVSDVSNGGAILRTAAFFGVHGMIVAQKGNFGLTPSFFRLSSGAVEHVKIYRCHNLPKTLSKIKEIGVRLIGLSEHSNSISQSQQLNQSTCLVMGAEEKGISNAVSRIIDENFSIRTQGSIKSLNVSVATGLAMEYFFREST